MTHFSSEALLLFIIYIGLPLFGTQIWHGTQNFAPVVHSLNHPYLISRTQVHNIGAPYDSCKHNVETISNCLLRCNQRAAEHNCGCQSSIDRFDDNSTLLVCGVLGELCTVKYKGTLHNISVIVSVRVHWPNANIGLVTRKKI